MQRFKREGTDITEEQFREIHLLQTETVLTSEEEDLLRHLIETLTNLKAVFVEILREEDPSRPRTIAGLEDKDMFYQRVIGAMISQPGDQSHDIVWRLSQAEQYLFDIRRQFDRTFLQLSLLVERADDVEILMTRIENKEIRYSRFLPQKGKKIIRQIVGLKEDERKNIRRKIKVLSHMIIMFNSRIRRILGEIFQRFYDAGSFFRMLREDAQARGYSGIPGESLNSIVKSLRKIFTEIIPKIQEAIDLLNESFEDVNDFKHWLTHAIHQDQRALQIQERIDKMPSEEGFG
ncbi:MAG: hypothetical protein IH934_00820 [Nanoarchaeota archaeon]|nr:hypothetical protein [Nanoarchaeota archaeon]